MNVSLEQDVEEWVAQRVADGTYRTTAEAVSQALRLLRNQEEMKKQIAVGLEQANRGEFEDFTAEDVIAEGKRSLEARKRASDLLGVFKPTV